MVLFNMRNCRLVLLLGCVLCMAEGYRIDEGCNGIMKFRVDRGTNEDMNSIRQESTPYSQTVADVIQEKILKAMTSFADTVANHYLNRSAEISDIYDLVSELTSVSQAFSKISNTGDFSLKTFNYDLDRGMDHLNAYMFMNLPRAKAMRIIVPLVEYANIINCASASPLSLKPIEWVQPLTALSHHLQSSADWYQFLIDMNYGLAKVNIQTKKRLYNVKSLNDWGQPDKPQGIEITESNLLDFLSKIKSLLQLTKVLPIEDYSVREKQLQLNHLNRLLVKALGENTKRKDDDAQVFVEGYNVLLSDAIKFLQQKSETPTKNLIIHATYTVIIDSDLKALDVNKGHVFNIEIVSPNWYIDSDRKIDLDGESPGGLPPAETRDNGDGIHGSPGLPGGNGGIFKGIGSHFTGGTLIVTANGGKGGSGQQGGNGRTPRTSPALSDLKPIYDQSSNKCKLETIYSYSISDKGSCDGNGEPYCCMSDALEGCGERFTVTINGRPAEDGGKGGNGGQAGDGGNEGIASIFAVAGETSLVKANAVKGVKGSDGLGGKGAAGSGDATTCKTGVSELWSQSGSSCVLDNSIKCDNEGAKAKHGSDGNTGANKNGIKPVPEPDYSFEKAGELITIYKIFALQQQDMFTKTLTEDFLAAIDNSTQLQDSLGVLGLTQEFRRLSVENTFAKGFYTAELTNKKTVDFRPLYRSTLYRTINMATRLADKDDMVTALKYLHTAVLGRLMSIEMMSEPVLIVNMPRYLRNQQSKLNEITSVGKDLKAIAKIRQTKQEYTDTFQSKFEEANLFIDGVVVPEMNNIERELNRNMRSLVNEIEELKKAEEKNLDKLKENREKLRQQQVVNGIFGGLKLLSNVLSFAGPYGQAAGAVVGLGTGIAEGFTPKVKPVPITHVPLPSSLKNAATNAANRFRSGQQYTLQGLTDQLTYIQKIIKDDPEVLGAISQKLETMKTQVTEKIDKQRRRKRQSDNNFEVASTLKDLCESESISREYLDSIRGDLAKIKDDVAKEPEKHQGVADRIISTCEKAQKVADVSVEIFKQFQEDDAAINEISEEIANSKQIIDQFNRQKENVRSQMMPELDNLISSFDPVINGMADQSHVSLDVTRWKIKSIIRDTKLDFKKSYTEGFQVEEYLSRGMDKLEDAMATLIGLYDRLENYKDQMALGNYIANINEAGHDDNDVTDAEALDAITKLSYASQASVLLEQHHLLVTSLAGWAFPFGQGLIQQLDITLNEEKMMTERGVSVLLAESKQKVRVMLDMIEDSVTTIRHADECLWLSQFGTKASNSPAFFIWKNETHASTLSDLLAGNKVYLYADVARTKLNYDAIKFNKLELLLTSRNKSLNSELQNIVGSHFSVDMKHTGNSYYRIGDKVYVVKTPQVRLPTSLKQGETDWPIDSAGSTRKLSENTPLLSPFTLWSMQLLPVNRNVTLFESLKPYFNSVDLTLSGYGSYIRKAADTLHPDEFYDSDPSIDVNPRIFTFF